MSPSAILRKIRLSCALPLNSAALERWARVGEEMGEGGLGEVGLGGMAFIQACDKLLRVLVGLLLDVLVGPQLDVHSSSLVTLCRDCGITWAAVDQMVT